MTNDEDCNLKVTPEEEVEAAFRTMPFGCLVVWWLIGSLSILYTNWQTRKGPGKYSSMMYSVRHIVRKEKRHDG